MPRLLAGGLSRVFWAPPLPSCSMDLQAMARVWRDGQRKPCFVYRLLTTGAASEAPGPPQADEHVVLAMHTDRLPLMSAWLPMQSNITCAGCGAVAHAASPASTWQGPWTRRFTSAS